MTTDEILMDAEDRMEKALDVFRNELQGPAHRPGHARPCSTASASSTTARRRRSSSSPTISTPGPAVDRHQAVRRRRPQGDREGDPLQRPGPGAEQRRQDDPPDRCRRCPASSGRRWSQQIKKPAEDAKVACRNIRRDAQQALRARPRRTRRMTEDDRDKGKEQGAGPAQDLRGQDRRAGRQEVEGSHGTVDRLRGPATRTGRREPGHGATGSLRHRARRPRALRVRSGDRPCDRSATVTDALPDARTTGLTADAGRRQPAAVRRQPAHAAAARAALEEVPREVRRADHQDPARRRPAVDGRRSVRGDARLAAASASAWSSSSLAAGVRCRELRRLGAVAAVRPRRSSCSSSASSPGHPSSRGWRS